MAKTKAVSVETKLRIQVRELRKKLAQAEKERDASRAAWWKDREFMDGLVRREVEQRIALDGAIKVIDGLDGYRDKLIVAVARFEEATKKYEEFRRSKQ